MNKTVFKNYLTLIYVVMPKEISKQVIYAKYVIHYDY